MVANPKKRGQGADAYFLGNNCCGVADGVGEWVSHGIDPKDFA